MAGAPRGGRLDGMDHHTDIPTGTPTADPVAVTAALAAADRRAVSVDARPRPARPCRSSASGAAGTDRMLGGVCGGLAESLGADAALLRVLVVALTLITGGAAALVYLAAWVLAPEGDRPAI